MKPFKNNIIGTFNFDPNDLDKKNNYISLETAEKIIKASYKNLCQSFLDDIIKTFEETPDLLINVCNAIFNSSENLPISDVKIKHASGHIKKLRAIISCKELDTEPELDWVHKYAANYVYEKLLTEIIEKSYIPERKMFSLSMGLHNRVLSRKDVSMIYNSFQINPEIEILSLCYNRIRPDVANDVANYLIMRFAIKKLYLRTNFLGDSQEASDFITKISLHSTLMDLDLSITHIGDSVSAAIKNMLKTNKILQKINLYSNDITEVGCAHIAEGLKFNKTLQSLNLGCNDIGIKGAEYILQSISMNVKTLKLYGCKLSEGDHTNFNKYLSEIVNLTSLDLSNNDFNKLQAVNIIHSLQNIASLTKLDLRGNNLGDLGASAIAYVLSHKNTLKSLKLAACSFNDIDGIKIISSLLENNSLIKLDMGGNNFTNAGLMQMAEKVCLNFTLQQLQMEPPFTSRPQQDWQVEKAILKFINDILKLDDIKLRIGLIKNKLREGDNPALNPFYNKCLSTLKSTLAIQYSSLPCNLFPASKEKRKNSERDISDEAMALSTFGQGSNMAKRRRF